MLSCLSILMIVNGSSTKEFRLEGSLRQGDPLSPFLFLIVVEAHQVSILEACDKGVYNGLHLIESGSNLSLLQYADYALFLESVNISKSKITEVGVPSSEVESLASSLGCSHESLPFSYLRLLVGKRLRTCSIINRFRDILSSWKAKSSSIGGGSDFGSLLDKNMRLLRKWKWRFLVENNALWRMVIKDFYGIDRGFGSPHNSFGSGGIWCDIIKVVAYIGLIDSSFNTSFVLQVSNGFVTSFWADPWCSNGLILKYTFSKLFALETYKYSKVADRWKFSNGHWGGNWSRNLPPRWRAIDDLSTHEGLISSLVRESDGEDKWVWKGDASKSFKVKFLSKSIQNLLLANDIIDSHCLWNSWIPKKVNICLWRASLDRLLTCTNLSYCGVVLPSLSCHLCSNAL
ncbi:hypothetical protein Tco_1215643 [Tanacetum coccineum]